MAYVYADGTRSLGSGCIGISPEGQSGFRILQTLIYTDSTLCHTLAILATRKPITQLCLEGVRVYKEHWE